MQSSRASIAKRQQANVAEVAELNGLQGKSREVVTKLWGRITAEKNAYNAALAEYKVNHGQFSVKKAALVDMLNPARMDAMLAANAESMADSWVTLALQKSMRDLTREMAENFEAVFTCSEDIKKLMQGVYNTFIEKFGFQKMKLPSLDLDPHRTKLKLLIHETDAFAKDPINVAHSKGPFVKKFHGTLARQARAVFLDAKQQADRWLQAVVLPLEVQMKDHKAQLQSRLDNLAKINEKTTSINEQMGILKAAEADLRKQREMIEGLIARVTAHEARVDDPEATIPPAQTVPVEFLQTTKLSTFESARPAVSAPKAATQAKPAAPAPTPAAPLMSDDLFSEIGKKPAPAFDPMATQKLPPNAEKTQILDGPQTTQRVPFNAEKTETLQPEEARQMFEPGKTQKLNPGDTQRIDPNAIPSDAEVTQRIDDSIWRLQEAKRILQGINNK
jgi:hypothetical protein